MTLVSEAKMIARRTQAAPTMKATHDQFVRPPMTTTGTPARTAMPYAPPSVPPINAAVLKNSALTTLTSRTRPDDCRVNSVLPESLIETGTPSTRRRGWLVWPPDGHVPCLLPMHGRSTPPCLTIPRHYTARVLTESPRNSGNAAAPA